MLSRDYIDNRRDFIRNRRLELGKTLEDIGREVGVSRSTVQRWESGNISNMRRDKIAKLAAALEVSPAQLIGYEDASLPDNLAPFHHMGTVPLIGSIACGKPILAEENVEDYVDLPRHIRADFALTCKGDSMIDAGIQDGDIVYIRQQGQVQPGQIAAVLIDDEATLKRVYVNGSQIILQPANPAYAPMVFTDAEADRIRMIGLAVVFTHALVRSER